MRYAIIDIGSNTVKMTLYEDAVIVKKYSQPLYLISHIQNGALSDEGLSALTDLLTRYGEIARDGGYRPYAYATASLRPLSDPSRVLNTVKHQTSLAIDIVSGEEEARLSLFGIARVSGIDVSRHTVCDLGGGSLEVVLSQPDGIVARSFPLGALRSYLDFVSDTFPTADELKNLYLYAVSLLKQGDLPKKQGDLLAVGGTLRAVCRILATLENTTYSEDEPYTVTRENALRLLADVVLKNETLLALLKASLPSRMHTVAPGLTAFLALLDTLGYTAFTVVSGGAREGYLESIMRKETNQ